MSSVQRRDFLKWISAVGVAATTGLSFTRGANAPRRAFAQDNNLASKVIMTKSGPISVHTYMAPEASFLVTSHLIETPNSLVLVDTQFMQTFSKELRSYADSLGKPIDRVILSHQHGDHWLGANNFADVPFSATPAVAASVQEQLDAGAMANYTNFIGASEVPAEARVPQGDLALGELTIDGVTLLVDVYKDAESPEEVVIRIPDAGIVIVQDLLYNNTHFFPLGNNSNWISVLDGLRAWAGEGYEMIMCGHGLPTAFGELDVATAYLTYMDEALQTATSVEEFITLLTTRYPSFAGALLLGFAASRYTPQ